MTLVLRDRNINIRLTWLGWKLIRSGLEPILSVFYLIWVCFIYFYVDKNNLQYCISIRHHFETVRGIKWRQIQQMFPFNLKCIMTCLLYIYVFLIEYLYVLIVTNYLAVNLPKTLYKAGLRHLWWPFWN